MSQHGKGYNRWNKRLGNLLDLIMKENEEKCRLLFDIPNRYVGQPICDDDRKPLLI